MTKQDVENVEKKAFVFSGNLFNNYEALMTSIDEKKDLSYGSLQFYSLRTQFAAAFLKNLNDAIFNLRDCDSDAHRLFLECVQQNMINSVCECFEEVQEEISEDDGE